MVDDLGVLLFRDGQNYGTLSIWDAYLCGFFGHGTLPCSSKTKGIVLFFRVRVRSNSKKVLSQNQWVNLGFFRHVSTVKS